MRSNVLPRHECLAGKVDDLIEIFRSSLCEHLFLALVKELLHGGIHSDPRIAQVADSFAVVQGT